MPFDTRKQCLAATERGIFVRTPGAGTSGEAIKEVIVYIDLVERVGNVTT